MSNGVKDNIKKSSTWIRGLYMLLFAIFCSVAEAVLSVVVVFQFTLKLFTGNTNDRLRKFGQSIATYIYQILQFLSFNTEAHPYPFGAWPKGEPKAASKTRASETAEGEAAKKIEKD